MNVASLARLAVAFGRTRYGLHFNDRDTFERWQQRRLERFLHSTLDSVAFYRHHAERTLSSLPILNKSMALDRFADLNTRGISLDTARAAAYAAENGLELPADFSPALTAGLSSGTSGRAGVFLANDTERATWAGILLARMLDHRLLKRIVSRSGGLRVAFFLRANSALYTTLRSRQIDFRFFDLRMGVHAHLRALAQFRPEVLVAPASVLSWLAAETSSPEWAISPTRIISVAEVLEADDKARIEATWGQPVHQIYQCMEGFLGYTCSHGTLHLNEEFVHIEPEWLDESRTRFVPIITDFTRRTQLMVRYRLDDVLRVSTTPCACGRVTLTLDAIEGRLDDVLWLRSSRTKRESPLFPDAIRYAVTRDCPNVPDYTITQRGTILHVSTSGTDALCASIQCAVQRLIALHDLDQPEWRRVPYVARKPDAKRRRIVCETRSTVVAPHAGQHLHHA